MGEVWGGGGTGKNESGVEKSRKCDTQGSVAEGSSSSAEGSNSLSASGPGKQGLLARSYPRRPEGQLFPEE